MDARKYVVAKRNLHELGDTVNVTNVIEWGINLVQMVTVTVFRGIEEPLRSVSHGVEKSPIAQFLRRTWNGGCRS